MAMDTSKVLRLPRKLQHIFWKPLKSIALATQNDFRHVTKHVWMSRSATPATRKEATGRLKPHRRPYGPHADACGRLRTAGHGRASTPSTPRPPEWNGNPCYAFGKNTINLQKIIKLWHVYIMYIYVYIYCVFQTTFPWTCARLQGLTMGVNIGFNLGSHIESHAISVDFGSGWPSRAWMRHGRRLAFHSCAAIGKSVWLGSGGPLWRRSQAGYQCSWLCNILVYIVYIIYIYISGCQFIMWSCAGVLERSNFCA